MTTVSLEGTGTRITFGSTGVDADLLSIDIGEKARQAIETTHLGTVGAKTFKPGQTVDRGQIDLTFDHNPEGARLVGLPAQMVTIYYPAEDGQSPNVFMQFAAIAVSEGAEEMVIDLRMVTKLTLVPVDASEIPGYWIEPEPGPDPDPDLGPAQVYWLPEPFSTLGPFMRTTGYRRIIPANWSVV